MFLGIRTLNISNEAYARQPKGCRIVVCGCTVMMVQGWRDRESIIIQIRVLENY